VFVLPIALAGLLHFPARHVDADTFVLALPMAEKAGLALLVFIGGLSAATGMVIVETIALSDDGLQRPRDAGAAALPLAARLAQRRDLSGLLLGIRRGAIVASCCSATLLSLIGEAYALVTIGLSRSPRSRSSPRR
jgi:hypothetical protein